MIASTIAHYRVQEISMRSRVVSLVRHGVSGANVGFQAAEKDDAEAWMRCRQEYPDWANSPLTSEGERQAEELGPLLRRIHGDSLVAYCSPLVRAADTARLALRAGWHGFPVSEILTDDRLRERDWGAINRARCYHSFRKQMKQATEMSLTTERPPSRRGESAGQAYHRVRGFLEHRVLSAVDNQPIIVFAHGEAIKLMSMILEGVPLADWPRYAAMTRLGNCQVVSYTSYAPGSRAYDPERVWKHVVCQARPDRDRDWHLVRFPADLPPPT